jgi:hypothetical protein
MEKKPRYYSSLIETCRKWPEYHVCSELRLKDIPKEGGQTGAQAIRERTL